MRNKSETAFSINSLLGDIDGNITVDELEEQMTKTLATEPAAITKAVSRQTPSSKIKEIKGKKDANSKTLAYLTNLEDGSVYPIKMDNSSIGCGSACDITLEKYAKEHTISRMHASLIHKDGSFFLTDCSSNGTYLAQPEGDILSFTRLEKGAAVEIKDDQIIRFANKVFRFTIETN